MKHNIMEKEKALDAVEKAIDKAFEAGKESVGYTLQWCYNYVNKCKDSEEKEALIKHLKEYNIVITK